MTRRGRIALLALGTPLTLAACNAILGNEEGFVVAPDASPDVSNGATLDAAPPEPDATPAADVSPPSDAASPVDAAPPDAGREPDAAPACVDGQKRCDGICASVADPAYGCGSSSCAACALPRASARCAGLACAVAQCEPGFADCNGVAADGCETDLSDPLHCGACNARCGASAPLCAPAVAAFGATFACSTGCGPQAPTLCGTECVDLTTSISHCGGCATACPDVANASVSCAQSQCRFACNPGWHACGAGCANSSSPQSCGASCTPCPSGPNAAPTCTNGACGIACMAGFADCDRVPTNGCETNLTSDPANCGACGRACPTGSTCVSQSCTPVDAGPPPPPPPADAGPG